MESPRVKHWFTASRPKTLSASVSPILLGGVLAGRFDIFSLALFLSCLSVGLLLQIAANLANDYYDWEYGTDRFDRIGPARVSSGNLIKASAVRKAFLLCIALSAVPGLFVAFHRGWELILLGAVCMLLAVAYTAKPLKLAYRGLGEAAAFIFFGIVPCGGTYYVLTGSLKTAALLAGIMCGLFAAAIMAVNNLRDIHTDKKSGKLTLAGILGEKWARALTVTLFAAALLSPTVMAAVTHKWPISLAALFIIPNIKTMKTLLEDEISQEFNRCLANAAKTELLTSLTICILWMI